MRWPKGLPLIPRRRVEYRGLQLEEFDLDAALARRPQLVLVDEFAHTNAPESRHPKRYQDVLELLDAGMDVFTTLNIQHIESRAEAVHQITGITIQRNGARHRARRTRNWNWWICRPTNCAPGWRRARCICRNAPPPPRIASSVPATSRRCANWRCVSPLNTSGRMCSPIATRTASAAPWKSGQRLLVAVSSSPTSAALVRWTRRLAGELHATWVAVYVETSGTLSEEDQTRLARHLALARELGAEIVTTTDDDVVRGILRIAREQNATQIVVGKPAGWRALDLLRGGSMLNRLIRDSGQIDIHAVRAEGEPVSGRPLPPARFEKQDARSYAIAAAVVAVVTALNAVLQQWLGNQPVALVYLLSVVVLALFVGRGATLAAATVTALSWNFFFTEPRYTFRITNAGDAMMFATYFVVAVAMGQLASRLRAQQAAERRREQRATALYLLTRELAEAPDLAQLLGVVVRQVGEAFHAEVALSLPEESSTGLLTPYFASTWALPEKEQTIAAWAFQHRQPAGRGTDNLPSSQGLHLPLAAGERAAGVMSLRFHDAAPLPPAQRDLLDAFVRQVALVLDRQRLRDAETDTKLLAESERLGRTLLNSVSHELRTPLAAIASAASGLRESGALTAAQQNLAAEIESAAARLNRLVQSLLSAARLQSGQLQPKLDWCDVSDVVQVALRSVGDLLAHHPVEMRIASGLPLVKLDFVLMEQVLANLLVNAATHTPPGTTVEISARADGKELVLEAADRGPGLPAKELERVFDLFHRAPDAKPGGTGLGLAIVKGFVTAQGGRVQAANRTGGGAVFTIRLPVPEAPRLPEETA